MFTTQRALVFFYQRGHFFCNSPEQLVAFCCFQVNNRPEMNFTRAGMCIMHRIQTVLFQYLIEIADISRQVIHINSRVFNNGNGFIIAGQITQKAQPCFPECPYFLCVLSKQYREMIAQSCCPHFCFYSFCYFQYFFARRPCKFNNEDSAGVALYKKTVFALFNIVLGTFKYIMIDQFTGAWPVFESNEVGMQ